MVFFVEQLLNGIQLGVTLFLLASGLTLIFGVMGIVNLAHGAFYMIGAYAGAVVAVKTGHFALAIGAGMLAAGLSGIVVEALVVRRLYARDHLDQVLATFALILIVNQTTIMLFGRQPLFVPIPEALNGSVGLLPGLHYPVYRIAVIAVGLAVAVGLWLLVQRTRIGMLVRAGATSRDMVRALGVNIRLLYTFVFGLGALLAGLAGAMAGPILAVQVGMGEQVLILAFVIVIIGGVGSVRGAFLGALIAGISDTFLRAFLPGLLAYVLPRSEADALGAGLSSIGIYLLMAIVLIVSPRGLLAGKVAVR
jgi:branched-chain amino acid transport system permease protein